MAVQQPISVADIYSFCTLATPLSPEHSSPSLIRVLELLPAKSYDEPLRARLSIEFLVSASFEAISYTWHGPGGPDSIRLQHGMHISSKDITGNLSSALRHFRRKRHIRRLFADALCINQNDNVEKSAQVRIMGAIYKTATQVLIWLGPGSDTSVPARDDMMDLARIAKLHDILSRASTLEGMAHKEAPNDQAVQEASEILRKDLFPAIYESSWFTRVWIVQEVTLAKHVSLHLGNVRMDWIPFVHAMTMAKLTYENNREINYPSSFRNAWHLICIRTDYRILSLGRVRLANPLSDLIGIMGRVRVQDCTDDRDRIYALLGLQIDIRDRNLGFPVKYDHMPTDRFSDFLWSFEDSDSSTPSAVLDDQTEPIDEILDRLGRAFGAINHHPPLVLEPNYEASVSDVFTDFAWAYLHSRDEDILETCGLWQQTNPVDPDHDALPIHGYQPDYLPSWAPDFRKKENLLQTPWNGANFTAGKGFLPSFKMFSTRKQVVGIHGVIFDDVVLTIPVRRDWGDKYEALLYFRDLVLGIQTIAGVSVKYPNGSYITGGTFDEALSRTLIADGYHVSISRRDIRRLWDLYKQVLINFVARSPSSDPQIQAQRDKDFQDAWRYHIGMLKTLFGHTVFFTSKGYIGLAPSMTKAGDCVAVIDGTQTPFVLRRISGTSDPELQGPHHLIISPSYVHGVMHGESMTDNSYNEGWGYIPCI